MSTGNRPLGRHPPSEQLPGWYHFAALHPGGRFNYLMADGHVEAMTPYESADTTKGGTDYINRMRNPSSGPLDVREGLNS